MILYSCDGLELHPCGNYVLFSFLTCLVDGPANCSDLYVEPNCHASTSGEDSKSDIMITLQTNASLMCVVGYEIQFNGESKNVSLQSPSSNFAISTAEGQPFQKEIIVYTLDSENRTGQIPCVFSISGEPPCMI